MAQGEGRWDGGLEIGQEGCKWGVNSNHKGRRLKGSGGRGRRWKGDFEEGQRQQKKGRVRVCWRLGGAMGRGGGGGLGMGGGVFDEGRRVRIHSRTKGGEGR